jgi:aryl-alcohol dehydrogenase-like predicted oxidoreductase
MNYRRLGTSDLVVSEIAFGSWLTFSSGARKKDAIACVHRALHRGITLFDTANVYGLGKAEKALGEALRGVPRDRFVLATKLYFPMSDIDRGLSCAQVHKQIDASLERLQVPYVDLYQCHRYDERTPLEETMRALTEVVQAGKARYIGFSEWPIDRIEAALAMPGVEKFVSSQPQYSLLHRGPERELLPLCARAGISQIVWSPLAQGLLTGKYLPGAPLPANSRAGDLSLKNYITTDWFKPRLLKAIQELKPLAAEAGLTLAQFALAWVLRQPNVAAAIIGATRAEQIDENVGASGHALPAEIAQRAEAIIDTAS